MTTVSLALAFVLACAAIAFAVTAFTISTTLRDRWSDDRRRAVRKCAGLTVAALWCLTAALFLLWGSGL